MPKQPNTGKIKLSLINVTFFVREELDESRVAYFMDLYNAGAEVELIEVTQTSLELVKGRHRKAAMERLGMRDAEVVFLPDADRAELLVEAAKENLGGSLPPTTKDLVFTMRQLVEEKMSTKRIVESFDGLLPAALVRRYVKTAQAELAQIRLELAVADVVDNEMTPAAAAEKHGIDIGKLRQRLSGSKADKKKRESVGQVKQALTARYRPNTMRTNAMISRMADEVADGERTPKDARIILRHVMHLLRSTVSRTEETIRRFEAQTGIKVLDGTEAAEQEEDSTV